MEHALIIMESGRPMVVSDISPQELARQMKADLQGARRRPPSLSEEERRERQAEYDDLYPPLPDQPLP